MNNVVIWVGGNVAGLNGFVATDDFYQRRLSWRTINLDNARRYPDMKEAIKAEQEFYRQGYTTQKLLVL